MKMSQYSAGLSSVKMLKIEGNVAGTVSGLPAGETKLMYANALKKALPAV